MSVVQQAFMQVVSVNGVNFPVQSYEYSSTNTIAVTGLSSTTGAAGDTINVFYTGGAFNNIPVTQVSVGGVSANIVSQSDGSVQITVPEKTAGLSGQDLDVVLTTDWGYSDRWENSKLSIWYRPEG